MRLEHWQLKGTQRLSDDLTVFGQVAGDVFVESGGVLVLHGQITGDLHIAPGGTAEIFGMVVGNIINNGGILKVDPGADVRG